MVSFGWVYDGLCIMREFGFVYEMMFVDVFEVFVGG